MKEIFKDIPFYEDYYQVSNIGNVKRKKRVKKHWRGGFSITKEQLMTPFLDVNGYLFIRLTGNHKRSNFRIHQLVAIAFLNHDLESKLVVDHIDNNKLNNNVNNLQLITNRKNTTKDKPKRKLKTGVLFHKQNNKYIARICVTRTINLGSFDSEDEAGKIYDIACENEDIFFTEREYFKKQLGKKIVS